MSFTRNECRYDKPISFFIPVMLVACLVTTGPVLAAGSSDLEAVLEQARTAIGIEAMTEHPGMIRMEGDTRQFGMPGKLTLIMDGHGRFRRDIVTRVTTTDGFDGEHAWQINHARTMRVLELGDREYALIETWLRTGWWLAEEAPFEFELLDSPDEQTWTLGFRITDGLSSGRIVLDRHSALPREISYTSNNQERVLRLEGYEELEGFKIPHSIEFSGGDDPRTTSIRTVRWVNSVQDDEFRRSLTGYADSTYRHSVASELQVRRARTGHLMVQAGVDGRDDLGWFFFDTGAGASCLSIPVAEQLGLEPFGEVPAIGVGGRTTASYIEAESLQVGPLTQSRPVFVGFDLSFVEGPLGMKVAGVIGYDVIARCVVEYDVDGSTIALYNPTTYELDGAQWQPLLLYSGHPNVYAEFEGKTGVFMIDTGAVDTVAFHRPAVEQFGLLEGRETTGGSVGGGGGFVRVRKAPIEYFKLGGKRFENPQVSFAIEPKGGYNNPHVMGTMGSTFLQPFVMVLDYANRRIAFIEK